MKQQPPLRPGSRSLYQRLFANLFGNLSRAFQRYNKIQGEQCAASFAFYAFFSLFPLLLVLVAVVSFLFPHSRQAAHQIVGQLEDYVPLRQKDKVMLIDTVDGVLRNGWKAGLFGFLVLIWTSLRFFQALVVGVNRAWGQREYSWRSLPIKNLLMMGILLSAVLLGVVAPLIFDRLYRLMRWDVSELATGLTVLLPALILFYGSTMFYKFAPRKPPSLRDVWPAAVLVAVFQRFGQHLFEWYLNNFTNFNAVYGAFGTIMALLLWIYWSGVVFILGGCLSATARDPVPS
jgi:YihY family inner membrane protein